MCRSGFFHFSPVQAPALPSCQPVPTARASLALALALALARSPQPVSVNARPDM